MFLQFLLLDLDAFWISSGSFVFVFDLFDVVIFEEQA
jgi:hypothetical protein